MTKDNHPGRKLAIGALLAGAAGYIAGILTAPKSGKETREELADKAGEVKDEAAAKLHEAQNELGDLLKQAKTKSVALGSKAREEFNESVVRAKDAKDKVGYLLKSVKAGEADDPELDKAIRQAKQAAKNLGKYFKD
jgi:gas vesicle protein